MMVTEAGGEGPQGMAAAGHVALNRLRSGYGGAKSLTDVIFARHQFEGMNHAAEVRPEDYQRGQQIADALLSGQAPDITNGATNFLNPELQTQLGRQTPAWAQGQGQRIGNHVFFGGQPGTPAPQQMAQNTASPPPTPPNQNGSPDQGAMPDLSQAGAGAQPFPPPAPEGSPPVVGAPPAAVPQAAVGGMPASGIEPEQLALVEKLLRNPRTHDVGMAYAMELQKKAAEGTKYDIKVQDGHIIATDPQHPERRSVQTVSELRTHVLTDAQAAERHQPPGTVIQEKADGTLVFQRPDGGQMVASQPGQPYREAPIPGGQNDPTRMQAPQGGFAYAPSGGQAPIHGGPADPASPLNLVTGEGKLRDDYDKQITPYIQAREGYQKVVQAAKNASPAGDIALVFGYMKTLDPGSTVREGEQATVQNSGTVDQTVQNMYNKLITGKGRLSPEQRAQFATSAANQFEVYQRTADAASERFGSIAKSYGYDPSRIVRHFDPIEPYHPPSASGQYPPAVNSAHQSMVQAGAYNPQAPLGDKARPFLAASDAALKALDTPANRGKYVVTPTGAIAVID
jgi:hypothetical protein